MTKAILAWILLFAVSATAQVQRYQKENCRDQLLNLAVNSPFSPIVVEGEFSSPQAKAFFDYYKSTLEPRFQSLTKTVREYMAYKLLLDGASWLNDEEKNFFNQSWEKASSAYNQYFVSEEVTAELKEWARLAEGLPGDWPESARRLYRERDLESFPASLKAKLDEVDRLESEFERVRNEAPGNALLPQFEKDLTDVVRAFKAGEIDWPTATQRLSAVYQQGGYALIGQQAVAAKGENLNQVAVLRSELAKAKGFATWADYMLEVSGQGYDQPYRGAQNQRQFLTEYIRALRPIRDHLWNLRLQELGVQLPVAERRSQYQSLISYPSLLQIRDHFPKGELTNMWEQTMLASGFKPETLAQILVDDEVRENKFQTGAYLSPILPPYTPQVVVNAATMNLVEVAPSSPQWKPGFLYIMQTHRNDGVAGLRTAFHEGGHALEKALKHKQLDLSEGYGYIEVPSTTMENFTMDAEVLSHLMVPVAGQRPSLERVKELVSGVKKNEILNALFGATQALFDIELWAYDYSAPGAKTFLQRVQEVDAQVNALSGEYPDLDSPIASWYDKVATSHFLSGSVRYIGYVYADIGSRMMVDYLSDELERTTGRRSWYQQPGLANLFAERFFQVGWRTPFPGNVEKITGRPFAPKTVVDELRREIGMPPN